MKLLIFTRSISLLVLGLPFAAIMPFLNISHQPSGMFSGMQAITAGMKSSDSEIASKFEAALGLRFR